MTRKPKSGTWEMFCEHANEVPSYGCPCPATCGCRWAHCKGKELSTLADLRTSMGIVDLPRSQVLSMEPTAPQRAVELAFKAGWAAGYYDGGEHECRMFHPTADAAWAEFLGKANHGLRAL